MLRSATKTAGTANVSINGHTNVARGKEDFGNMCRNITLSTTVASVVLVGVLKE